MIYRASDKEYGRDEGFAAHILPASLRAEMRMAFREWLDASKAWSTLRHSIEVDGGTSTARRKLEELEQRLNTAAEAFQQAQHRLSKAPFLCTSVARER